MRRSIVIVALAVAVASPAAPAAADVYSSAYVYFEGTTLSASVLYQQACVGWDRWCGRAVVVLEPVSGLARISGEIPAGDGTSDTFRFDVSIDGRETWRTAEPGPTILWGPQWPSPYGAPECAGARARATVGRSGLASGFVRRHDASGEVVWDAGAPGTGTYRSVVSADAVACR